jgi:hypothetical protein
MTPKERKKSWDRLPHPKPSWETFKRLLGRYEDPEKARMAWLTHWGNEKTMKKP